MTILILCTGNSCRSQMAEAYLKSLDPRLDVQSAGTSPASRVHPKAVAVMKEIGLDLADARPMAVDAFLHRPFTYVITVCDNAKETCPAFTGSVQHRLHMGFDDPGDATGSDEHVMNEFRRVRDEIRERFSSFYHDEVVPQMKTPPL